MRRAIVGACILLWGCHHGGIGPTVGYAFGHGPTLGVEGGAGWESDKDPLFLNGNVGFSYRFEGDDGDLVGYAVFEPWSYVGLTVGGAMGSRSGAEGVVGVWDGVALPLRDLRCSPDRKGPTWLSLAVGYRWAGLHEIYFTPKIVWGGWCQQEDP